MMAIAYYLLKVTIISGLLFGYYHLALKDKVFHQWNRFYLLASVIFALIMPFISFTIQTSGQQESRIIAALQLVSGTDELVAGYKPEPSTYITPESLLSFCYLLVSIVMMAVLLMAITRIISITKKYEMLRLGDIHFLNTHEPGTPFSFFKYIFWNEDIDIHTPNGKRIFEHEMVHVREHHTVDKIFLQFILIAGWINPFFWLIRSELHMIHEFIADRKSIGEKDSTAFAELILQSTYPKYNHLLSNPFFQNSIKRRLSMINKSKNPGMNYLSRISALVLAACVLLAFTLKPKNSKPAIKISKKITVVIDAGHGGTDNGAIGGNLVEKNLNLQLAKMVKEFNTNPEVEILLTRESDRTVALQERLQLTTDKKADLFISIHTSATGPETTTGSENASGFEAFIARNNGSLHDKNIRLASILLHNLSSVYTAGVSAKKSEQGIYVLDKNTVPGLILECGYITNIKDRDFFTNQSNQKIIAEIILKSIEQYFSDGVQVNNKPSWQDTLPIKSAPAKKPVASAEKPLAPGSPAATPSKVTPAKETTGTPGTAPSKVTPAKAGTPANPATPPTKVTTANPGAPVANEINVVSTVNTTVSNNVQSNVSMSVNNNVATSVNTSKDNHHTVNMTTSKNANSVNVNSKQQQGTLSVTSTSPGSQIQIRANQGNTGDSSFQLNITGPEPLYVVDGVTTTKNFVYTLDPNKISSMEVLKGTEAIKQYGESGKNGVIKISTK